MEMLVPVGTRREPTMTPLDRLVLASEEIARVCERHGVAELAVFGSIARGDARPDSDIDLLVSYRPEARVGLIAFNRLRRELENVLGRPVDLVPKSGLKAMLRTTVLAEARVIYEI